MQIFNKVEIQDSRLTPDLKRIRSGALQVFYKPGNRSLQTEDADFSINPPERHVYSELIDGRWFWVNGCDKCNGRDERFGSYIRCVEHDVCCTCKTPRSDLKEIPWGDVRGFQCKSCRAAEHEIEKAEALGKMGQYDEWDFRHKREPTCPYCKLEFSESWEYWDAEGTVVDCHRCDNKFELTAEKSVSFTSKRIGAGS